MDTEGTKITRRARRLAVLAAALLLVAACAPTSTPRPEPAATQAAPTAARPVPTPSALPSTSPAAAPSAAAATATRPGALQTPAEIIGATASQVILALRYRDMDTLATFVHPSQGVRFSPSAYVTAENLAFTQDQIPGLLRDPARYLWGSFEGSGNPIDMTPYEYYERFVYDVDFAEAPEVRYNTPESYGGTIDNSLDFFPGAIVVEYHFPGFDPAYGGLDWRSLRLAFQQEGERWYLVGIIHAEWAP